MPVFLKQYLNEHLSKILSWSKETHKFFGLQTLVDWYIEAPQCTTFRVNSLLYNSEDIVSHIKEELKKRFFLEIENLPSITINNTISECITIGRLPNHQLDLIPKPDEIIVDCFCGAAVLRGAHVFAPGVMGMLPNISVGAKVSVYADLSRKCLRGLKQPYEAEGKLFVGNGIMLMNRRQLFDGGEPEYGIAVLVTDPASGIVMFNYPDDMGILQNFPSMVCIRALDPKPGHVVLDMCASPGNKTTHIATLMKDEGLLIAIDRPTKIQKVISSCQKLSIKNCVKVFKGDSTKIVADCDREVIDGPPFMKNSFDRILADVPCSGSGQRPMFSARVLNEWRFNSFPPLQRKFVRNAIELLKPGGYMVYSTCSIFCEENECIIAWILETFPEMELTSSEPIEGGPGLPECGLDEEQRQLVQRFGPGTKTASDTIGFFLAKLKKKG